MSGELLAAAALAPLAGIAATDPARVLSAVLGLDPTAANAETSWASVTVAAATEPARVLSALAGFEPTGAHAGTAWAWVAVAALATAATLLVPPGPDHTTRPRHRPDHGGADRGGADRGGADSGMADHGGADCAAASGGARPLPRLSLVALGLVVALALLPPRALALGLVAVACTAGLAGLVHLRRSAARAATTADRVRETCEALADDLAAGASAERALARSCADWPGLEPVLAAHRLGLDVPDAWRRLATQPGAGGLRLVAATWQVSGRTGQGLAAALRRVADDLRAAEASRRVVASELASARATGRLVAGLPVVAWLMGSGSGEHPVSWLLAGPAGWTCLVVGGGLLLLGLAWIELLARSAAAS